ncbi:TBCC-domain-containing protein [Tuber magnatum]|uniref:TBCC-domain-containing protein n=1 Tax=Tuber magnatum TaxID=42249 RepID=A0A317T471_9PEZI|nr:TBCC-domain-containing protein [Tuber magnatum]
MDVETNTKQNFYARFHDSHAGAYNPIPLISLVYFMPQLTCYGGCLALEAQIELLPSQIRGLSDKLSETRKAITPKQKFSFKGKGKDTAAAIGGAMKPSNSSTSPSSKTQTESTTPTSDQPKADNLTISNLSGRYVNHAQPPSASAPTSTSFLLLSDISTSIILFPTAGPPLFSSAAVKNVTNTLLYLSGAINGPTHLTSLTNATILVACRQLRMHDAKNVDVYLLCSSRPIIEDCSGIRFAPLDAHVGGEWESVNNLWDQVDDFKWLKSEHSPNWEVMREEERIGQGEWEKVGAWRARDGKEEGEEEEAVRGILRRQYYIIPWA